MEIFKNCRGAKLKRAVGLAVRAIVTQALRVKFVQPALAGTNQMKPSPNVGVVGVVPCARLRYEPTKSVRGWHCLHAAARFYNHDAVRAELDVAHDEEFVNSGNG